MAARTDGRGPKSYGKSRIGLATLVAAGLALIEMMDLARLDPGTRRFAELLFAAFPSWAGLARMEETHEPASSASGLSVDVPSPVAAGERNLLIRACGDTVSVFYCKVDHDLIWSGLGEKDELFDHAIELVKQVVEEQVVVAYKRRRFLWKTWWQGEFVGRGDLRDRRRLTRASPRRRVGGNAGLGPRPLPSARQRRGVRFTSPDRRRQGVLAGTPASHRRVSLLVPYRESWPRQFERVALELG